MKPLPNINDEAAMLLRGKRSAIGAARKEAVESLRDMLTFMQSEQWLLQWKRTTAPLWIRSMHGLTRRRPKQNPRNKHDSTLRNCQ